MTGLMKRNFCSKRPKRRAQKESRRAAKCPPSARIDSLDHNSCTGQQRRSSWRNLRLSRAARVFKRETKLLRALANHAALSLESFLRFSQLERSKRQWVQDIDAISDYIVVHDRSWKIVRTNRSLADYLGRPPVELVGEPSAVCGSSLREIPIFPARFA
jgi:PAS domain-containing protein